MWEIFRQIVSLVGAATGLFAFIMMQLERKGWGPKDIKYLLLCVIAGSFLTTAAIIDKNGGFILLNSVFTGFAIRGIYEK